MKVLLVICLSLIAAGATLAQSNVLNEVNQLEQQGQFKEATKALNSALKQRSPGETDRKRLEFELDRLDRIKKDFPSTKEDLFTELKKAVNGLTKKEFERWIAEGRFDSREIDGKRYFMGSSISNLFFRYPELEARRATPKDKSAHHRLVWENCVAIRKAALAENKPYVLPKRFQVTMTVTAKKDAALAGEIVRAWLPIPRRFPFQTDFKLVNTSPAVKQVAPEDSPIRSAYLEQPATKGKPTEFKVEYEFTMCGVRFDVDPLKVSPLTPALSPPRGEGNRRSSHVGLTEAELKTFTSEAPHVVFTPEIRALSQQIAGDETNPYLKARKFYDWIGGNIKYSYAIEYSTIRNISEYCRTKGYGDCGQEALLFITLCRLNGIPARWQSGWNMIATGKTIHDWTEVYIAPYGWIPVDPYMAIFAMRYAVTLTQEQRNEVRDFYFGGLDWYRMAANSDHNQELIPSKNSFRSDDVDFQRGELEFGDTNLYFDKYSYSLTWRDRDTGESSERPEKGKTFRR
jgi:transglutaminase-like putative cysteine protease